MRVYVMGPFTQGDLMMNLRQVIDAAEQLRAAGHIPFLPHLSMFWHLVHPHDYEYWMSWDQDWLDVCEAAVRLPGPSSGSEREIARCKELNIPHFYSVADFLAWCINNSKTENIVGGKL